MAGEGRKEEREKEKEAGLGAFVNGGAKETPESVLRPGTPFRISKKSGPQSWGSGGGGAAAQGRAEHWLPLHKHTQVPSCHLQCLPHQDPLILPHQDLTLIPRDLGSSRVLPQPSQGLHLPAESTPSFAGHQDTCWLSSSLPLSFLSGCPLLAQHLVAQ